MKSDATVRRNRRTVDSLDGPVSFLARHLTVEEIGKAVALARSDGWYANVSLLEHVAFSGLSHYEDVTELRKDLFLTAAVAREVWILTLRFLERRARAVASIVGAPTPIPHAKSYTSEDLATPGLLYFIQRDLRNLDPKGFVRFFLRSHVKEIEQDGVLLSARQRRALIRKHGKHRIIAWIMGLLGADNDLIDSRRLAVLDEDSRVYAVFVLVTTLDWRQYLPLVRAYNRNLTALMESSRALAGLSRSEAARDLGTATPLFPELLAAPAAPPLEVVMRVANDVFGGRLKEFSRYYRRELRDLVALSKTDALSAALGAEGVDERFEVILKTLCTTLTRRLAQRPRLALRVCEVYLEDYCNFMRRRLESEAKQYLAEAKLVSVPDCYLLVEGPSERVYLERVLELVSSQDVYVRVEDCGGKAGLKRRFREVVRNHPYLGGVLAVFDADAEREAADSERLAAKSKTYHVRRFSKGTVEDQIPPYMLARGLNEVHPDGQEVKSSDLRSRELLEQQLKRVAWEKKRAALDKVALARAVARRMTRVQVIPRGLRTVADCALALARLRPRGRGRVSYHDLDEVGSSWARSAPRGVSPE